MGFDQVKPGCCDSDKNRTILVHTGSAMLRECAMLDKQQ